LAIDNPRITPVLSDQDITKTAALAKEIWTEHYTPIIGSEQVSYMLAKFQSQEAIAQQIKDGYQYFRISSLEEYGYLSIQVEDKQLFISKIYVKAAARGRGLGKRLMQLSITIAKENSLTGLRLTVNKHNLHSIAAYEKMGFTKKREVVFDIGDGYVMDDYEMVFLLT
jgi:ribosomal protein S18 acetylase RimI-like enzyme